MRSPERLTVRITRARAKNLEFACQAFTRIHGRKLKNSRVLIDFLTDSNCYLLLALEDDRVVGSLNGYRLRLPCIRRPAFLIYEIDVRAESQNRGVGKSLVRAFINEAKKANAEEVWVLSNKSNVAAMAMYRACGFKRKNRDDVMLELPL